MTSRFRRWDSDKLRAAKEIFSAWERNGIIRRSSSQWSSPLHLVKKKDGSWRPCGNFRRLNLDIKADKYQVPNLADFSSHLEGCTVFSTLDLKNGYLQVPLEPSVVPKTAVITPFGLFEFLRMPFGLKNAGMTFQRFMHRLFNGLDFVFIYINDVLIASKSRQEHAGHLREVLRRLRAAGLVLNVPKCTFACSTVEFLSHQVSASGIRPLPGKVEALRLHPPTIQHQGAAGFLRTAELLLPIHSQGGPASGSAHRGPQGSSQRHLQAPVVPAHAHRFPLS